MMWVFDEINPLKISVMNPWMMNKLDIYRHKDSNNKYKTK